MTRKSKRELSRQLDDLDGDAATIAPARRHEWTITNMVVDENGENPTPFERLHGWQDETGEWHSERTDLRDSRDTD